MRALALTLSQPVPSVCARIDRIVYHVRPTLKLATPIIAAQMAMMGTRVADTVMAGRLSAADLAAVASGASFWMVLALMMMGLANGVSAVVSQRVGRGDPDTWIGAYIQQALWLAVGTGVVLGLFAFASAPVVMRQLGLSASATGFAVDYVQITAFSMPVLGAVATLRFGADGVGDPRPYLWVSLATLLLNVFLNWVLMWGNLGAPAMGAAGCALATVVSDTARAVGMVIAYRLRASLRVMDVFAERLLPTREAAAEWWSVGAPIGVMITLEAGFFGATGLAMARFGDAAAAAHQVAINFASVCFMVPLGVAFAATVRVGNAVGRGDALNARAAAWTAVALAMLFSALSAALMLLLPHQVAALYTDVTHVARAAAGLMLFAAAFQLVDCLQASAAGALRGYKDVKLPMLITLFAYWGIGAPVGLATAFGLFGVPAIGPSGLWIGLIAGLSAAAVLLSLRLWRVGRRPTMFAGSPRAHAAAP